MSKATKDNSKDDDSDMIDQVAKKYFSEIEHSVPHMQHVLFDFQNECYKTWKNVLNANISLHKEFLDKSGLGYEVSDSMNVLFVKANDEAIKYREYCRKIALSNIDAAKQNAKTLNDNVELYADMNRKMMQYWMSAFLQKKNKKN